MCGGILVIFSYSLYNKINFPLFSAKGTIVIFFFCTLLLSPLPQGRELKYVLLGVEQHSCMSPLPQGRELKYTRLFYHRSGCTSPLPQGRELK